MILSPVGAQIIIKLQIRPGILLGHSVTFVDHYSLLCHHSSILLAVWHICATEFQNGFHTVGVLVAFRLMVYNNFLQFILFCNVQ